MNITRARSMAIIFQLSGFMSMERCEALPGVQGSIFSPGRSRTSIATDRIIPKASPSKMAIPGIPKLITTTAATAVLMEIPATWPKAMKALARPCSSLGRTSMAMPSTATSWLAPKTLRVKHSPDSRAILSSPSGKNRKARPVSTRQPWAKITQGRRRPIARKVQRSIKGPASNLKLQGRLAMAINEAMAAGLSPASAR